MYGPKADKLAKLPQYGVVDFLAIAVKIYLVFSATASKRLIVVSEKSHCYSYVFFPLCGEKTFKRLDIPQRAPRARRRNRGK